MENFQYSVQLSEQDWAEFSATTDECGLLQAGLASGDELLSSEIDPGDSRSSPPRAPCLPTGQPAAGGPGREDDVAPQSPVSRSWREPVLALGTAQQTPGTSARAGAPRALGPGTALPGRRSSCPGPASSGDQMQRLLRGPAPRPPGEPPRNPESPGHCAASQRAPSSPGAPSQSPGRKKRRAVGAKGGGQAGAPGSAQMGSPLLPAASPEMAELTARARQERLGPGPVGAPEPGPGPPVQEAKPGPGLGLSTPVPVTEQGTDHTRAPPSTRLHTVSRPIQEAHPDVSRSESDTAVSTPASKPQPDPAVSTPASKLQCDMTVSTPASKPQPDTDMTVSTPASKPQPDMAVTTPASTSQPDMDMALSTPASTPRLDVALATAGRAVKLEVASSPPVSGAVPRRAESARLVSTPGPGADATGPAWSPTRRAEPDVVDTEVAGSEPSAGARGHRSGEPALGVTPVPKKKRVRFSMAVPTPKELGSGEASGPAPLATARPSAPRTATGGHGGPGVWDAVAIGPQPHQPRILKHLPRPPPSAVTRAGPGSRFAVTLPEAYEFFFCDPIEEDEDAEAAAASQDPADVQWPDTCEFFFRDCGAQRSRRGGAPAPGDPVPISIPEAYEHFFGEDGLGGVPGAQAATLWPQAPEPPSSASQGARPGTPSKPAVVQQLHRALRRAGTCPRIPQPIRVPDTRCPGSSARGPGGGDRQGLGHPGTQSRWGGHSQAPGQFRGWAPRWPSACSAHVMTAPAPASGTAPAQAGQRHVSSPLGKWGPTGSSPGWSSSTT
ncbi:PGC-1 and ERR-induced regulator in muscle protein 1 [Plecturocebus cupreus]